MIRRDRAIRAQPVSGKAGHIREEGKLTARPADLVQRAAFGQRLRLYATGDGNDPGQARETDL